MKLTFVDANPFMARCLNDKFASFPNVKVIQGNILKHAKTCVVSPANSYGFMDGGIDKDYYEFFGSSLQQRTSSAILLRPEGHLPIGASLLILTGHSLIPYMILAPTMFSPEFIPEQNVYRALRATLRIMKQNTHLLDHVYCPGFGTGVGGLSPDIAAKSMAEAYRDFISAE